MGVCIDLWNMFLMRLQSKIVLIDKLHVESMNILGKCCVYRKCVLIMEINLHLYRPYYNQCHYCYIKYDVVGHLEDSVADTTYIAIKQNITTFLPELIKDNRKTKGKKSPQNRIEHYLSQLSTKQRRKLYQLYQLDFDMFGYDPGKALCKNEACI